jgi:hypothetical protein
MKTTLISVACLLLLAIAHAQERAHAATSTPKAIVLEAKVRKAREDFKSNGKESLAAILADGFREVETANAGPVRVQHWRGV